MLHKLIKKDAFFPTPCLPADESFCLSDTPSLNKSASQLFLDIPKVLKSEIFKISISSFSKFSIALLNLLIVSECFKFNNDFFKTFIISSNRGILEDSTFLISNLTPTGAVISLFFASKEFCIISLVNEATQFILNFESLNESTNL